MKSLTSNGRGHNPSMFGPRRTSFWNFFVPNAYLPCYMQQKCVCYIITRQAVIGIYFNSPVHENLSHHFSHYCHKIPTHFLPVVLQIQITMARFLQVFTATKNSLCLLVCNTCDAAKQLYRPMTFSANMIMFVQWVSLRTVYCAFTAIEQ